jgi:MtN3 and saliva related transmembrane protein
MDMTNLLGLIAGFLTTVAFIPQVTKIWKSKSAKDISLPTYIAFATGVALWTVFGVVKGEMPIVLWNAVTLVLAGAILAMKIRFDRAA